MSASAVVVKLPGLSLPHPSAAGARRVALRWHVPVLLALLGTIPAFYLELLSSTPGPSGALLYAFAAATIAAALVHTAAATPSASHHLRRNLLDAVLIAGLLLAAAVPPSAVSPLALSLRTAMALLTLVRMAWTLQPLFERGSLPSLLALALGVLGLCGMGFWWLEPHVTTLGDGLWLAFTTAATVGYGDIVPTTPASKIFAVFVVLLGFAVLSLVTAAIASFWVESQERLIEREILHDLHREMRQLHAEVAALREAVEQGKGRGKAEIDANNEPPPGHP